MQTPQRRVDPPVIRQLEQEPWRFRFFEAMRVLELALLQREERDARHRMVPRDKLLAQRVRFRSTLNLSFPPSELGDLVLRDASGEQLQAGDWEQLPDPENGAVDRIEITPAFMGMLGAQGALPLYYTELLARHEQTYKDTAARAFLDVFTTRAVSLFYSAWHKYRLPLHYEHDRRRAYLPLLIAIAGLDHAAQREPLRDGDGAGDIFDETAAGYAAAIQHRPISAVYLQRVLSDYFRIPIRVEQFTGRWYDLPPEQRTTLAGTNAVLGMTALAGDRIWQRDLRVRLWIGPLRKSRFQEFFPGRAYAKALEKMLAMLVGVCFEYEIRLTLAKEDVGTVSFANGGGAYLGWDSFMATEPEIVDRSDATYELHPLQQQ